MIPAALRLEMLDKLHRCAFSIPTSLLQLFTMRVQVGMLESVAPIFDSGLGSTPSNISQAPLAALRDLATRHGISLYLGVLSLLIVDYYSLA